MESSYFNNGNFREYSSRSGILQFWNGNSWWPW